MTVLDRFLSFAKGLPADQLGSLEATLAEVMENYSEKYALTDEEIAETDRRMAEVNPEYSTKEDIAAIFGKPFSA